MNYVTLHQACDYSGISETGTDAERMLRFIDWSTTLIDGYKQRSYQPVVETRVYDAPASRGQTLGKFDPFFALPASLAPLRLDAELLELTELLNGDGTEILSSEYVLEPANATPKTRIKLRSAAGIAWLPDEDGNVEQVIQASGIWGVHDCYRQAWADSLDTVQDDPLAAGATTLTITSWEGMASDLKSPRFQAGQLLRLADEFVLVLSVAPGDAGADPAISDTLELLRAANGSTAAEHAQGTKIEIWRPMGTIEQACLRLAKWRYSQKDTDDFDKSYVMGSGIVSVPSRLPADVVQVLGAPGKARL